MAFVGTAQKSFTREVHKSATTKWGYPMCALIMTIATTLNLCVPEDKLTKRKRKSAIKAGNLTFVVLTRHHLLTETIYFNRKAETEK